MGAGMGAAIILIVFPGQASGAHFNPAVTLAFLSLAESGVVGWAMKHIWR